MPGDNEYGTWGSRYDDQKQWKLCNGQWIRVGQPPKPKPKPTPPEYEQYLAERVKCKPPKKVEVVRAEPVRNKVKPQSGSTDSDLDTDDDDADLDVDSLAEPVEVDVDNSRSPPVDSRRIIRQPLLEEPVDVDALRNKYRPKEATKPSNENLTKPISEPQTGTILLEPIRAPTPPLEEIKVEPITPTYVEMKKPLKSEYNLYIIFASKHLDHNLTMFPLNLCKLIQTEPDGEEEKMMEDPNLMWMRMGPAQYGPPFGTLGRNKAREEEWIGPPCELCHKQIEERRCMLAENMKFHCWHFACSFCLKTLKPSDFLIAEADRKPYCLNCHKREFPEISLTNLNIEEE